MKEVIKENKEAILKYNEIQIEKLKAKKQCEVCDLLFQFIDDYKMITSIILEENEIYELNKNRS